MAPRLREIEQKLLLDLAAASVEATVSHAPLPEPPLASLPDPLREPRATFVTLTHDNRLCGCIGTLVPSLPLALDVIQRASSAATSDPRFPPLRADQVPDLTIEISILSTPIPLVVDERETIPYALRPRVDGVILTHGEKRATFLPQVWARVPDPIQFLDMLCRKAGLPQHAWRDLPVQVSTYEVFSFERRHSAGRPSSAPGA